MILKKCKCGSDVWDIERGTNTLHCSKCGEPYPEDDRLERVKTITIQVRRVLQNLWHRLSCDLSSEESEEMNNVVNGLDLIEEIIGEV